jgi:endonuclease YncB( thermonuclease family)
MPAAALLALLALLLAGCGEPGASPSTGSPQSGPAEVVRVVDGDTLEADVAAERIEIRLLGVNAPERGECWSEEARVALEALVEGAAVTFDPAGGTDRFGRTLGYLSAGGRPVNLALVEMGAALALDDGHPLAADFLAAEEAAVAAGRGWWAPDACGPASGAAVEIAGIEADPEGRDEDHLDDEWVVLLNRGTTVDLSGWTLRDESSSNRYRFPTGTVLASGDRLQIRTGCGPGDGLAWCSDGPVWSNGGDTVLLLDALGNVAARRRYPGAG